MKYRPHPGRRSPPAVKDAHGTAGRRAHKDDGRQITTPCVGLRHGLEAQRTRAPRSKRASVSWEAFLPWRLQPWMVKPTHALTDRPRITGNEAMQREVDGNQSSDPSAHCWQSIFCRLSVRCLRPTDVLGLEAPDRFSIFRLGLFRRASIDTSRNKCSSSHHRLHYYRTSSLL